MICKNCILDNDSCKITFDEKGVCNYCNDYSNFEKKLPNKENRVNKLENLISKIKFAGRRKKYDCIIGLSGGVDSSYLAYLAVKKFGLKPLAVHFDNGWNSDLAVTNVNHIVDILKLDLITYVIEWEEFRDLQLAYIRAAVVDLEVPTDHFIFATMYKYAKKHGIKYILNGSNYQTEFIMPVGWNFNHKLDLKNLLDIHKRFGTKKLSNYPKLGFWQRIKYKIIHRIVEVSPLSLTDYNIREVKLLLKEKLRWKDYGGKHHESVWARFYQGYILPKKYNIDKRKAHLSNLICSGQLSRKEALEKLEKNTYTEGLQEKDKIYVLKKLGLSEDDFGEYINGVCREHDEFLTETKLVSFESNFLQIIDGFCHYAVRPIELLKFIKYKFHRLIYE